jgi:hypothetical protein
MDKVQKPILFLEFHFVPSHSSLYPIYGEKLKISRFRKILICEKLWCSFFILCIQQNIQKGCVKTNTVLH